MTDPTTVADLIRRRADDDNPALRFEDQTWTWREYVDDVRARARLLESVRPEGAFNVAVLLENVPEFPLMLGACALVGATVIGVNPTRRGAELERDLAHTEATLLVTESTSRAAVSGLDLPFSDDRVLDVDSNEWPDAIAARSDDPLPEVAVAADSPFLLIFTSGTTGDPKAAQVTNGRFTRTVIDAVASLGLTSDTVAYVAMPMFHSNSLFAGWGPMLANGGATALRRQFSASGFLPDVRRYGATYFNYVGKPLSYILATPEGDDDADNRLELVMGNEAAVSDIKRFSQRFDCSVIDNYGSTEGGIYIIRTEETPDTALGVPLDQETVILDPATSEECPLAAFGDDGKLLNSDDCIGEIANRAAAEQFEGYWQNEEANNERVRDGIFWSGDLGYRDAAGFFYFAGRANDWLRVDGENIAGAPIERILDRHEGVDIASVYAVPNAQVGDDVMVAIQPRPRSEFDPAGLGAFLAEQGDLHAKGAPRYVRVSPALPQTPTNKVLKRQLRSEHWETDEPVWVRDGDSYRPLTDDDRAGLRRTFEERGRADVLDL